MALGTMPRLTHPPPSVPAPVRRLSDAGPTSAPGLPKEGNAMTWTTRLLGGATAAVLLFGAPGVTRAAQTVNSCDFTCTADCELVSDITCIDGNGGIALTNGADFDFKGHSLICNDNS